MTDSYTEVTRRSYGNRLGGSFKGILFGILLFLGSFPLLFWNEGRAIQTEKSLEEGAASVVSVSPQTIDPQNEGKLVHFSGMATTEQKLSDPAFNISENAIRLSREVLVYQWKENRHSTTEKEMGGSTTTSTRYDYVKVWSDSLIPSKNFRYPEHHQNPNSKPYSNSVQYAQQVNVDAYPLNPALIEKISGSETLLLNETNLPSNSYAEIVNGEVYIGTASDPQIGDVKIRYSVVRPKSVSVIAKQQNNQLYAYQTSAGDTIQLLVPGNQTAEQMFSDEIAMNTALTWILRFVGFLIMMIGLNTILKPLSVLLDVLPFLGNIIESGTGLVAGVLAFALSLLTIGIAWFFYRPLLTLGLVIIAAASFYLLKGRFKSKRSTA